MPSLRLVLISAAIWLGAGALGLGFAGAFEPGWQQISFVAVLVLIAVVASLAVAIRADMAAANTLAAITRVWSGHISSSWQFRPSTSLWWWSMKAGR